MKKIYRPFNQFPYCCVPATMQWILYRRNFDILDQETIGAALGLRLPKRFSSLVNNKDIKIIPDNSKEFGTQILEDRYSINNFFQKFQIPLKISEEHNFKSQEKLEKFILDNIHTDKDIILRFNNKIFKTKKGVGHFALICSYNEESKIVRIGDPDPPSFKKTTLEEVFKSISNHFDNIERGLYLVDNL